MYMVSTLVLCCAFCLIAYLVHQAQGYLRSVRCYDYMSDNLANDFAMPNRRNAFII